MKDSIYLLLTGMVCAALSWAYWYFLGEFGLHLMSGFALIVTITENVRLRRKVRTLEAKLA
jgi:hypothetical protein